MIWLGNLPIYWDYKEYLNLLFWNWVRTPVCTTQRNFFEILLSQPEIRSYLPFFDWFGTKRTSVWFNINRNMVYTIWSPEDFNVCTTAMILSSLVKTLLPKCNYLEDEEGLIWRDRGHISIGAHIKRKHLCGANFGPDFATTHSCYARFL